MEKLLHDVRETAQLTDLSRTTIYALMGAGRLSYVKVGSRRLVPHAALVAFVDSLDDGGAAA